MELAEDAIDAKGVRLVSAGTTLSVSSIRGLRNRNIENISIFKFEELTDEQRSEKRIAIEKELDARFSKVVNNPVMQELKEILLDHKCRYLR